MPGERLPALPDDSFRRVLCVAAHPDDVVEHGVATAIAAWTARGVEVAYLMLTRGEAGLNGSPPERTADLRTREQVTGAEAVGVTTVEFLHHRDGVLEYGLDLRRDIARHIRSYRPDVVLVGSWDVEFVAGLNQADHRAAGLATLDAVRDAGNRWVFPELLQDGLEPWSARWLLVSGDPRPTHGLDVSGEPMERGIASLEAHVAFLAGVPGHPSARTLLTTLTAPQGAALGVANAVLFRTWDLQAHAPLGGDGPAGDGPGRARSRASV